MIMNLLDINNNPPLKRKSKIPARKGTSRRISKSPYFKDSEININIENKSNVMRLNDSFFMRPCISLARDLLGKTLVRKMPAGDILKGIIVETESYLGVEDMASHSFKGKRTDRNEAMFLKPGTAYVYSIYGMYYCFNISSLEEGSAVLIRALEPIEGIHSMLEHRYKLRKSASEIKVKDLCNGPSKLCQAFRIEKDLLNKVDLSTSECLWLEEGISVDSSSIISCKRIGIDSYGEEWASKPLRFYVRDNSFVSRRCKVTEKELSIKLV